MDFDHKTSIGRKIGENNLAGTARSVGKSLVH